MEGAKTVNVPAGELERRVRDRRLLFLACLFKPYRPGVLLYATTLEYQYFTPGTARNDNFQLYTLEWEEMGFGVIEIPIYMRAVAERVARKTLMRIADGVPTLIESGGGKPRAKYFPLNTRQVFTVENAAQHPVHRGARREDLWPEERRAINEVYRRFGAAGHPSLERMEVDSMVWDELIGG